LKYRSRADISSEILKIAERGVSKTRIMYGAYLSHRQVNDYLATLLHIALLEYEKHFRIYRTTAKGVQLCRAYEKVIDLSDLAKR
jgi:predicted transcriptional regulator